MVAAGFGISIVPETIQQLHAGGVTYHAIKGAQPRAPIMLAYRAGEPAKVVREFVNTAKRVVRSVVVPGV
jgi:DNA-binding transcriptional LysR family regulator